MMLARLVLAALAFLAAPAFADDHLTPAQTMRMAAVRTYNPAGPMQAGGGGHAFGPGGGYTLPAITNPYALALGDSRTNNGGGVAWAVGSITGTTNITGGNGGYAGLIFPVSGYRLLPALDWNYGVGAQSPLGIAGRNKIAGNACPTIAGATAVCLTFIRTGHVGATQTGGTAVSGAISAGSTTFDYLVLTGGAPQVGDYISANSNSNFACTVSSVGTFYSPSVYQITVAPPAGSSAQCVTGTGFASNSALDLGPAAYASNFASFLDSTGLGATNTDVSLNQATTGTYSPAGTTGSDPAKIVFFLAGTNAGAGLPVLQSLKALASILDDYGPTRANKVVIASNESPRGLATGCSAYATGGVPCTTVGPPGNAGLWGSPEVHTVPSGSPYQVTLNNTATYFDTVELFYAPCGATTGGTPSGHNGAVTGDYYACGATGAATGYYALPSGDGTRLLNCVSGSYAALASQTGLGSGVCASGVIAGYYAVSSAGVYTFNSADAGKLIAIYARWTSQDSGAAPNSLTQIHDWFNSSSCGSFTPTTGYTTGAPTYALSGAQCGRPWVKVVDTWSDGIDSLIPNNCTPGNACYPKPFYVADGLHFGVFGGLSFANLMVQGSSFIMPATPAISFPSVNNIYAAAVTLSNTSIGTVTSPDGCPATAPKYWMTGSSLLSMITGGAFGSSYGLVATPFPVMLHSAGWVAPGTTITCIDHTVGLQMSAGSSTPTTNDAFFIIDSTSLIANGVFDHLSAHAQVSTAAITGCGTANAWCGTPTVSGHTFVAGYPAGWTWSLDAGTQTAISTGQMGLSFGIDTNPWGDGYDYFTVQLSGYVGAGGSFTVTDAANGMMKAALAVNDIHRGVCDIRIGPGPNGRLSGFTGVTVKDSETATSIFPAPGVPSANTTYYGQQVAWVGQAGGGQAEMNDSVLANGPSGNPGISSGILVLPEVTPPATVKTSPASASTVSLTFGYFPGSPVSATVWVGRCAMRKVTQ